LSISPSSSAREIKIAYRRMAEVYHPDKLRELPPAVRKEGEEIMRLLNEAKSILLDQQARAQYDHMRADPLSASADAIVLGEVAEPFDDFEIEVDPRTIDNKMKRVLFSMKEVFVKDRTFQRKISDAQEIVDATVIGEDRPQRGSRDSGQELQEMTLEFDVVSRKGASPSKGLKKKEVAKFRVIAVEEDDDGADGSGEGDGGG